MKDIIDTTHTTDIIEVEFKELDKVEETKDLVPVEDNHKRLDQEFEYSRNNIIKIIETSEAVLLNTAALTIESEHPRMVEVYSGLIKNLVEINKSIFELREKRMKLKGEFIEKDNIPTTITNNAIFIGSTEDLLQKITNQ